MNTIRQWLRDPLAPPEPGPDWRASGVYLEHLRDGWGERTEREGRL